MNIAQALRISTPLRIAFAGAGGKTTAMFQLAHDLRGHVIVTATTHLGEWQTSLADQHVILEDLNGRDRINFDGITLVTGAIEGEKTKPINQSVLKWLHDRSEAKNLPLLIEADGSRQHPFKAPAEHEPAIPDFVDLVVLTAGLNGLSKPLNEEFVHRPEIFAQLSQLRLGEKVTPDAVSRVLSHPQGGLKNIPPQARRVVLLNQADTPELQATAQNMSDDLLSTFDSVIIASLQEEMVHAVHEPTAGIILAAGESKRFGRPKQLLDWHGRPFVRQVAETALHAGLRPVVIVTGAYAAEVESAVKDLPVRIVHNRDYQDGQSTSIHTGITAITHASSTQISREDIGSTIFLLADQPQIPVAVIHALIETHARGLYPIVAPLVLMEQRANPVLFDKITFPDLLTIEGDVGGRAIFSKHKVEFMPWHDDILLLDVDKPEDYERLLDSE